MRCFKALRFSKIKKYLMKVGLDIYRTFWHKKIDFTYFLYNLLKIIFYFFNSID
jgi:hypothetical protein